MTHTIDVDELIARPLDVIARLRAELKEEHGDDAQDGPLLALAILRALSSGAPPALEQVPVLSRESLAEGKLPPHSLVRYRGMVQDQYEPEYFVGSFDELEVASGKRSRVDVKYVDSISQRMGFVNEYDGPGAKTVDRLPLFCVPVPGQSKWAQPSAPLKQGHAAGLKQSATSASSYASSSSSFADAGGLPKRQRNAGDDAMDCTDEGGNTAALGDEPAPPASGPPQKSQRAAGESDAASVSGSPSGGTKSKPAATGAFHHGQELDLAGLPCVVKLYDFREGQVKLNETAEFVGVLGYDQPAPAQEEELMKGGAALASSDNPFHGLTDFSRKIPPPSLAPRVHCVFHRVLPACHPLPVDPNQPKDALYALQGPLPFSALMRDTKRQAIAHLATGLGGDTLAAEYALLALLSRPYVRTESWAPGSLSLNLRGLSAEDARRFHAAVADMVPKCVAVPVTTKSLSEKFKFAPKKDYEADRLMLSNLQLSEGTVVILDETKLEPGQVGSEGVDHIAALKSLISLQKIPYDFGFYKMDFEVDHPTIALSHGGSLVQAGAAVPVVAAGEACASSHETALPRLRVYVEATRRMDLALDEVSSAFAEEDFVKSRQQGHALTGDDFHRMLTVARLTALSLGDAMMNASHWNHMKELEARVAGRVQQQATTDGGAAAMAAPVSPGQQAAVLNAIPENS